MQIGAWLDLGVIYAELEAFRDWGGGPRYPSPVYRLDFSHTRPLRTPWGLADTGKSLACLYQLQLIIIPNLLLHHVFWLFSTSFAI